MKKTALILISLMLFNFSFSPMFSNEKIKDAKFSDLPTLTQDFIKKYFPNKTIAEINIEKGRKAEIEFKDGIELDFGREGFWKEIESEKGIHLTDLQMLPGQMLTSLKDDFGNWKILKVDQEDLLYEVTLINKKKIKIRYDLNGQYLF
ncbi:MAG: PepSY-like domain-containing protein [Bacteroidales bacterium]|nr:PepSY-like domain-containing protein [Bacteroidales bacterium]